jgi:hypothetical protein
MLGAISNMTISLLDLIPAQKARAAFLKKEKRLAYKRKNKEIFQEYSRRARAKKKSSR